MHTDSLLLTLFFVTAMMSAHRPDHEFSWEADNAGRDPHPGSRAQYRGQGTGELALCLCRTEFILQLHVKPAL